MKTLLLLRHAKSSWDDESLDDHERPLNPRGKRDAPRIGQLLRQRDLLPELILCSTAVRARQTLNRVCRAAEYEGEPLLCDDLYLAPPDAYVGTLRGVDEPVDRVMVIGHNPGLESLLTHLTGEVEHFPTAGLAVIELPIARWQDLRLSAAGRLVDFFRPKELPF